MTKTKRSKAETAAGAFADKYYAGETYLIAEESFIKGAEALLRYALKHQRPLEGVRGQGVSIRLLKLWFEEPHTEKDRVHDKEWFK